MHTDILNKLLICPQTQISLSSYIPLLLKLKLSARNIPKRPMIFQRGHT